MNKHSATNVSLDLQKRMKSNFEIETIVLKAQGEALQKLSDSFHLTTINNMIHFDIDLHIDSFSDSFQILQKLKDYGMDHSEIRTIFSRTVEEVFQKFFIRLILPFSEEICNGEHLPRK